jgi:hypothetical protein
MSKIFKPKELFHFMLLIKPSEKDLEEVRKLGEVQKDGTILTDKVSNIKPPYLYTFKVKSLSEVYNLPDNVVIIIYKNIKFERQYLPFVQDYLEKIADKVSNIEIRDNTVKITSDLFYLELPIDSLETVSPLLEKIDFEKSLGNINPTILLDLVPFKNDIKRIYFEGIETFVETDYPQKLMFNLSSPIKIIYKGVIIEDELVNITELDDILSNKQGFRIVSVRTIGGKNYYSIEREEQEEGFMTILELYEKLGRDKNLLTKLVLNLNGYKVVDEKTKKEYSGTCRKRAEDLSVILGGSYIDYYPETCADNIKGLEEELKKFGLKIEEIS